MRTIVTFIVAASALQMAACKWTEFDDLEGDTWVDSTTKPDVKSSDYGIAVQRGSRGVAPNTSGGRLVVLGAGTASYSELIYSPAGESSFPAATALNLQVQYGIPNIGVQPLLLADPESDATSLIVPSDNGIAMLTGPEGMLKLYQIFNQTAPTAATYMRAPGQSVPQPLVAFEDLVFGAQLPALPPATPQPQCKLVDGTAPTTKLSIRALGAVRNGATDDVLAWDASGKLYKFPTSVFNGCAPQQAHSAVVDTGFMPDAGSQILSLSPTLVLVQGHRGDAGYLRVFNAAGAITAVGEAVMVSKLRTAAILDVSGTQYVVAGVPTALVDGKAAGQVVVHKITATGIETAPVATLNDAQAENNQSFGRAVTVMPFNGKQVIVVAADNEVFVYFRLNQSSGGALYDETRQGR